MKTLTNAQIKNIIKTSATKKDGGFRFDTAFFIDQLIAGAKAYTTRSSVSGRHTMYSIVTSAHLAADVLKAAGYTVVVENDSPRGGQLGKHFKLTRAINASAVEIEAQVISYINQIKQ